MNKKIIALAVAFAATGASAATLYENEQTKVAFKGEIDAYLNTWDREHTDSSQDVEGDLDLDMWAKIQFDAEHKVNANVTVFGSFELETANVGYGPQDDDTDYTIKADDLYAGAYIGKNFGFAVGEVGDFGDSLDAITIDNTNEGFGYMDDFTSSFESKGHALSLKYDINNLKLIADTYFAEDEDLDAAYGLSAEYTVAGVKLGASYQDRGNRVDYDTSSEGDNDTLGFAAGYGIGDLNIAANYVMETVNNDDVEVVGVAADYQISETRLYVSWFTAENKDASDNDEFTGYTVGADYAVSDDLLVFLEYSATEDDQFEAGTDYTLANLGVYYTF